MRESQDNLTCSIAAAQETVVVVKVQKACCIMN